MSWSFILQRVLRIIKVKIWKYTGGPGRLATYEAAYAKQQLFEGPPDINYSKTSLVYGNPYAFMGHLVRLQHDFLEEELRQQWEKVEEAKVEPEHN